MCNKTISRLVSILTGGILLLLLGIFTIAYAPSIDAAAYLKWDGVDGETLDANPDGDCKWCDAVDAELIKINREIDDLEEQKDSTSPDDDSYQSIKEELSAKKRERADWMFDLAECRSRYCQTQELIPGTPVEEDPVDTDPDDKSGEDNIIDDTIDDDDIADDIMFDPVFDRRIRLDDFEVPERGMKLPGEKESCSECKELYDDIEDMYKDLQVLTSRTTASTSPVLAALSKAQLSEAIASRLVRYIRDCQMDDGNLREHKNICQYNESDYNFIFRSCDDVAELALRSLRDEIKIAPEERDRSRLTRFYHELLDENSSCWVRYMTRAVRASKDPKQLCRDLIDKKENAYDKDIEPESGDIEAPDDTQVAGKKLFVGNLSLAIDRCVDMVGGLQEDKEDKGDDDLVDDPDDEKVGINESITIGAAQEGTKCKKCDELSEDLFEMESRKFQTLSNVSKARNADDDGIEDGVEESFAQWTEEDEEKLLKLRKAKRECHQACVAIVDDDCPDCDVLKTIMKRHHDAMMAIIQNMRADSSLLAMNGILLAQDATGTGILLENEEEEEEEPVEEEDSTEPEVVIDTFELDEDHFAMLAKLRRLNREYQNSVDRYRKCVLKRKRATPTCPAIEDVDCPSCVSAKNDLIELEAGIKNLFEAAGNEVVSIVMPAFVAENVSFNYEKIVWTYEKLRAAYKRYFSCLRNSSRFADAGMCKEEKESLVDKPYCPDCEQLADEYGRIKVRFPTLPATDSGDPVFKASFPKMDVTDSADATYKSLYGGGNELHDCILFRDGLRARGYCGADEIKDHNETKKSCPNCSIIAKELQELLDKRFYMLERQRYDDAGRLISRIAELKDHHRRCLDKWRSRDKNACPSFQAALSPSPIDIEDEDKGEFTTDSFFDVFFDITVSDYHADAIAYLKRLGIVQGNPDGSFKSRSGINRAEFTKIVVLAVFGEDPDPLKYRNCFPDVQGEWFARYVCYAFEQKWVEGNPDGTFKPGNATNKAEAVKIVTEVLGLADEMSELLSDFSFEDVDEDAWFARYVHFLKMNDVLDDTDVDFKPSSEMSRGGMSELIYRILLLLQSGEMRFG